jgi:hypothetical protein
MDDNRTLRLWFQIFFAGWVCLIYIFISLLGGMLFGLQIKHFGVLIVGLLITAPLGFALPWLMDLVSRTVTFLFYGSNHSDPSYESRFYQDDMARAKRLVREKRFYEAVWACREIIQKAPKMHEARFHLARVYEMVGQVGLALYEYDKLRNLRDELGPTNVFVIESERAIEVLRDVSVRKHMERGLS